MEKTFEDEGRVMAEDTVKAMSSMEDGIAAALVSETKYFIKEIKKKKSLAELGKALEKIKENDIYCDEIAEVVSKQLKKIVPKLVKGYVAEVDAEIVINTVSKGTTAWIESWSKDLAELMKLNSHKEIESILKTCFEEKLSIAEATRAIMDSGIRDEYYKARRAALTEVLRAHNVSKYEAAMQNPSITKKMWVHTGAHKNAPRDNHVDMSGQTVPKDEPFELIGADGETYYPLYPVDPILPASEAVNCHCIAEDIVDKDILGLPLEERQRLQQKALDEMDDKWEEEFNAANRAKAGIE